MNTDERRARLILHANMEGCTAGETAARIRASDEAAGMVLVPREATEKQIIAALQAAIDFMDECDVRSISPKDRRSSENVRRCYAAMIAAATEAPDADAP